MRPLPMGMSIGSEAREGKQTAVCVELRPRFAGVVGQTPGPGGPAVGATERRPHPPVQPGKGPAECGLRVTSRPADLDPLQGQEGDGPYGHGQHLRHCDGGRVAQPVEPRCLRSEEAGWR